MEEIEQISESTIHRYSERYKKLGLNVKTLGWGSKDQQYYRFEQVFRTTNLSGKKVLDIGCGFGDFLSASHHFHEKIASYIGWDINPDLIAEAKNNHPDSTFNVVNLASLESISVKAEIGIMLGVLNLNFHKKFNNLDFSKMMIEKAFHSVSECLVVDFLSSHKTSTYPAEDFVFYHNPEVMLSYALSLTSNVRIFHDYSPIPQKEFLLVLEHD